jgi:hypothetical protein
MRGIADAALGGEHLVSEETCIANRGDACVFLVQNRDFEAAFTESPFLPQR